MIRVFHDGDALMVVNFDAPWMTRFLAMPVEFGICSAPADVSERLIEAVRLIVFELELLPSAARIALRKSLSVPTLNVLSTIRGSSASQSRFKDRGRRAGRRDDRLRRYMVCPLGENHGQFTLFVSPTCRIGGRMRNCGFHVLRMRSAPSDPDPYKGIRRTYPFARLQKATCPLVGKGEMRVSQTARMS